MSHLSTIITLGTSKGKNNHKPSYIAASVTALLAIGGRWDDTYTKIGVQVYNGRTRRIICGTDAKMIIPVLLSAIIDAHAANNRV